MGLTRTAITRPIFILMLVLACIFGGLLAYQNMRLEENPEVQFGVITVTTVYPGAGPEEVNTLVSRKVEESISGVGGLLELTSTSQEGVSVVVAQFEIGVNMDVALNDVRAKVEGAVRELPREAEKPTVEKIDAASEPIMYLSVSHPTLSPQQLRDLCDNQIKDRFARIRGVAQVQVTGGDEREIQVRIKKDKLLSYGLGILQVQQALAATSLNVPSGRIVGQDREYAVRVLGEYRKVEDIEKTFIRISDPQDPEAGTTVQLSDIADVVDSSVEKREYSRVNGKDAVVMILQKSRDGNAVEVADAANATIEQVKGEYGVSIAKTQDTSRSVKESLFDLTFTLLFGIVLVTAIVYLFLHDMRGTIIVFLAIPICLLATLVVLRALGFTLNNMSMLALSLAIGVLVDDAIVVLENIYRHLRMGEDPVSAALNGRGEIGLAAIAITMADIVVFLPMGFMGGVVGQFFKPLGIGFAVAVFMSLLVSFTVTPMLAARWYKEGEDVEHNVGRFAAAFDRGFQRFERAYRRTLEWALNRRWFVFITGFVVLIGVFMFIRGGFQPTLQDAIMSATGVMFATVIVGAIAVVCNLIFFRKLRLRPLWGAALFALAFPIFTATGFFYGQWKQSPLFGFEFAPATDQGIVQVTIEGAPGQTLERTLETTKLIEERVMKHPDVEYVITRVGTWTGSFAGAGGSTGTNLAQLQVILYEKISILDQMQPWMKHDGHLRYESDKKVSADLIESIGRVPGAKVKVSTISGFGFGSPIQMSFASDNRELLQSTVEKIAKGLEQGAVPGVINVDISSKPGKPEIRAIPDKLRMADSNLTTQEIAGVMRTLYEGDDSVKLRVLGEEYPIRVMMDPEDRNDPDLVSSVPVKFSNGNPIYLPQVATLESSTTVDKVDRRNRQEEVRINTDLLAGVAAGTAQDQISAWMEKEKLIPEGVKLKPLGQADVQARETQYLMGTLLLGLVLVYMLLASLYNNLLYPFIVQLAQPQAFVGALLALVLTDKTLNIVGFIGLIALVGLVGKNAILLVDYTNTLRARGLNRHDALAEAGPTRLRPIMMTTLAVLLGMLPVALAVGRGSEFRETLGIIIIGGISLSTILTLVVIPCSYTIFDDLSEMISRRRNRGNQPPAATPEPEPEAVL